MFGSWFDQKRDLDGASSVHRGRARGRDRGRTAIGPAYIALAAAASTRCSGLSPEDSLVVLTRASYVLSVALWRPARRARSSVGSTTRRRWSRIGAQFAFVGLVFAAGTWHWSDVPWSHFFAAFLAVAVYAVRFAPARLTTLAARGSGRAAARACSR